MKSNRPPASAPPRRYSRPALALLALIVLLGLITLALALYLGLASAAGQAAAIPTLTPLWIPTATPGPTADVPSPRALPGAAACVPRGAPAEPGTVIGVLDHGALEVQAAGETQQIHLAGIQLAARAALANAAGEGQPALPELLTRLVGQPVLLLPDPAAPDTGGQKPRYVMAGERFVNADLVRQGQAAVLPGAPQLACTGALLELERQARAAGLGIWQPPTPAPTRTFMPFVTVEPVISPGCVCSARPTCADFKTHAAAQACYNACNDYNSRLDEDRDGIACEDLP